jgi:hypothetical protein
MNPMHDHITNLLTMGQTMKSDPNIDKKALNKTLARLEEAQLWSKELLKGRVVADRNSLDQTAPANTSDYGKCTCPEGAVDVVNCPVHRTASVS